VIDKLSAVSLQLSADPPPGIARPAANLARPPPRKKLKAEG